VLRLSGEVLAGQPLVVLANYVFDSIETGRLLYR
jgi:hypothetical protein